MSYQVTVQPRGKQFSAEVDETLLDAALRQGLTLPYGCKDGACGASAQSALVIECKQVSSAGDIPVKTLPSRIEKLEKLAPDVIELHLRLPASERLQFWAGQYIDILLKDGKKRSYSLANAPHDDALLQLHIRHEIGRTHV